jgi:selenocysteine-specific elongation factor
MKRAIVGTAGHIDHGKTKLVEALTGIDCDRWAEEKSRGITIDLGFAHLEANDVQIGLIDVPGHERFLDNALAGLGGIRVMLLVVAADEGVKPQTREHLSICSLLGIPAGLVAVTKTDLVDPDIVELAQLELEELLAETPFAGAEIVPTSSHTGEGIAELKSKLAALAGQHATAVDPDRPTRLPVDRVFLLKGLGLVVTGTLSSGEIRAGDVLETAPGGKRVRVRSLQVHGREPEKAAAGERTALRITGVDIGDLARGTQLIEPGAYRETRRLLVRYTHLEDAPATIEGSMAVRFHLLSSEVVGRLRLLGVEQLEPGEVSMAEIRLTQPVVAARDDRFIVRRPSPPATLGGGVVIDPGWKTHRGRSLEKALGYVTSDLPHVLRFWVEEAGPAGTAGLELARRLGLRKKRVEEALEALVAEQKALRVPAGQGHEGRWLGPEVYRQITRRARRVLQEHFGRDRLAESMSKAEAQKRIFPGRAAALGDVYLSWLAKEKILVVEEGRVSLPGRTAELSKEESRLAETLLDLFERGGLSPPSPADLRQATGAQAQIIDGVVRYLKARGKLALLPGGLLVATAAIQQVRRELAKSGWAEFSVGEFKNRFNLTRQWAIPLPEHLDSIGVTRRVGDKRQMVGAGRRQDSPS